MVEESQKHDLGRLSWMAMGEGQKGQSGVSGSLAGCMMFLREKRGRGCQLVLCLDPLTIVPAGCGEP